MSVGQYPTGPSCNITVFADTLTLRPSVFSTDRFLPSSLLAIALIFPPQKVLRSSHFYRVFPSSIGSISSIQTSCCAGTPYFLDSRWDPSQRLHHGISLYLSPDLELCPHFPPPPLFHFFQFSRSSHSRDRRDSLLLLFLSYPPYNRRVQCHCWCMPRNTPDSAIPSPGRSG